MTVAITDMFCGAGGSSTGAVQAGAEVKLAINHWSRALETHQRNHPGAAHVLTDISRADPWRYPSTDILIASPECTNHSLSKGKRRKQTGWSPLPGFGEIGYDPAEERSRCTMWDPLRWAECHGYKIVILENVVDVRLWAMWEAWLHAWRSLDYEYEIVSLNSMFAHPTPQSRDRLYFVAWKRAVRKPDLAIRPLAPCAQCARDVEAVQSWKCPAKRAGKYRQQYVYVCPLCAREVSPRYFPASSAIDWSLPIQRIRERTKPLAEKTMARIAAGRKKFSANPEKAWLMSYYNHGSFEPVSAPVPTVTTLDRCALVTEAPRIEDCGFRMLEPAEIQAAMAFPAEYVVTGTRREKVRQLGNAVTPPAMRLLMSRCLASL